MHNNIRVREDEQIKSYLSYLSASLVVGVVNMFAPVALSVDVGVDGSTSKHIPVRCDALFSLDRAPSARPVKCQNMAE